MVSETVGILFSHCFLSLFSNFFSTTNFVVYFRVASSHMKCRLTILPSAKKNKRMNRETCSADKKNNIILCLPWANVPVVLMTLTFFVLGEMGKKAYPVCIWKRRRNKQIILLNVELKLYMVFASISGQPKLSQKNKNWLQRETLFVKTPNLKWSFDVYSTNRHRFHCSQHGELNERTWRHPPKRQLVTSPSARASRIMLREPRVENNIWKQNTIRP